MPLRRVDKAVARFVLVATRGWRRTAGSRSHPNLGGLSWI
jgi:hypothetical protein